MAMFPIFLYAADDGFDIRTSKRPYFVQKLFQIDLVKCGLPLEPLRILAGCYEHTYIRTKD